MNILRVVAIVMFASLSAVSIADDDTKVDAAKQRTTETCMKEAVERYSLATVTTDPRKYNKGGMRGYYVDLKVGKNNKKVRCIVQNNGKIMITKK